MAEKKKRASEFPRWWLRRADGFRVEGQLAAARVCAAEASKRYAKREIAEQEERVAAALIEGETARMMADFEEAEKALRRAQRLSWRGIDAVDRMHPKIRLELLQLEEARGELTEARRDFGALVTSLRHWKDYQLVAATRALACAIKASEYDSAEKASAALDRLLPCAKVEEASGARRWQAIYAIRRGAFDVADERLADAGRIASDVPYSAPLERPLNGLAIAHFYLERGEPGDFALGRRQFEDSMDEAKGYGLRAAMITAENAMKDLLG